MPLVIVKGVAKLLVKKKPIQGFSPAAFDKSKSIIYVLCGSLESLDARFKVASVLYNLGLAEKIAILSSTTLTSYDSLLKRRLTYDEWSIKKLESFGVNCKNIEPVKIQKASFGTLSEAIGISKVVLQRGYSSLILVSSPYHTRRVWDCFDKYLKGTEVNVYLYSSIDYSNYRGIAEEFIKLLVYKIILTFK